MPSFTHGKVTRVLVNATELSDQFKEYSVASTVDTAETSAFGTQAKTFVVGMQAGALSLSGMFEGSVSGSDAILAASLGAVDSPEITIATGGSFATGARIIAGVALTTNYTVSGSIGDVVATSAEFQGTDGFHPGFSLLDLAARSILTTGAGVLDARGATTRGAVCVAHVTTNASTASFTITFQHSADNITFVTLGTVITVNAAQTGGFAIIVPPGATINQYTRVVVNATTTGAATVQASVVRL